MSLTVYKYPLELGKTTIIRSGRRFDPVQVGMQADTICVWAEVDTNDRLKCDYAFDIYGTGWEIPEDVGTYVGSIFEGPYVWHIYFKRV